MCVADYVAARLGSESIIGGSAVAHTLLRGSSSTLLTISLFGSHLCLYICGFCHRFLEKYNLPTFLCTIFPVAPVRGRTF